MSLNELMQILGPDTCKQMIRDADAESEAQIEAGSGLFAEEFYANVHPDDMPPPTTVQLFSGMPRDPMRQLSDDEE